MPPPARLSQAGEPAWKMIREVPFQAGHNSPDNRMGGRIMLKRKVWGPSSVDLAGSVARRRAVGACSR